MEFRILTIVSLIALVYCCDVPIIHDCFRFLINDHDSMTYGIGLSIVSAYIFYIFQVVIPTRINEKKEWKLIKAKLEKISHKMHDCTLIIFPALLEIEENDFIEDLNNKNEYEIPYNCKDLPIIVAVYKLQEEIHRIISEIYMGKYVESEIYEMVGRIDNHIFKTEIERYYRMRGESILTDEAKKEHQEKKYKLKLYAEENTKEEQDSHWSNTTNRWSRNHMRIHREQYLGLREELEELILNHK